MIDQVGTLQKLTGELEFALKEANDEVVELRGQLARKKVVSLMVFSVICDPNEGTILVTNVPPDLEGRVELAKILHSASMQVMGR